MDIIASLRHRVSGLVAGGDKHRDDIRIIAGSGLFDRAAYLARYPDVAASGMDPVEHYVRHGADEGRDPAAGFDTAFYKRENPDVAASGMNPFRHYVEFGRAEGRRGAPDASSAFVSAGDGAVPAAAAAASGAPVGPSALPTMFDRDYYLKRNPDVARSGIDPFSHFCRHGGAELRDPARDFSSSWYWAMHMLPVRAQGNPLDHYLRVGRAAGASIRPAGKLSEADQRALAEACESALRAQDLALEDLDRIARVLAVCDRWGGVEAAARAAVSMQWTDARRHVRLADALYRQAKWWQVIESLRTATELDDRHADWFLRLGEASERMNRFEEAAQAYRRATELDPQSVPAFYRLGCVCRKLERTEAAAAAHAAAIALDGRPETARFGIGVFHQERGQWDEAAQAYAEALRLKPFDADLHYRHGMALDRGYRWEEALVAYERAISCDPRRPYWHYRRGFVLERLQRWAEAAEAYAAAATLNEAPQYYWRYRQGYALERGGDHEAACRAYLQSLEGQAVGDEDDALRAYLARFNLGAVVEEILACDLTRPDGHFRKGEMLERQGDLAGAAAAYADAVARQDAHLPPWYYRLGRVLHRAGRHEAACRAFREMRILRRPFGVEVPKAQTAAQRALMEYNEYREVLPLAERTILYESYGGATVGGNPYAIFMKLLELPEFAGWRHVWAVQDRAAAPQALRHRADVLLVTRDSDLYRRYLATASHLINDVTFPPWFIRREGQRYLNPWHGTPLKGLGKDIPGEFLAHRNVARNFLHATHLISPNPHTTRVMTEGHGLQGVLGARLAETGYPRIDRILGADEATRATVRERLGLDPARPTVLYAPTWRGAHGAAQLHAERLVEDLRRLADCGGQVVFRGHQMVERQLAGLDLPVALAPQEMETSDILAVTDILVTDYSSIFFDFLPTGRPILFYVYDLEAYRAERGLYFDVGQMPGDVCRDPDALAAALRRQLQAPAMDPARYRWAMETFCPHEDGRATERAIRFFFADEAPDAAGPDPAARGSVLCFAGHFPSNGITSSFLNLADGLAAEGRLRLSVAVDPDRVAEDPQRTANLAALPAGVAVLGRTGHMVLSPEEAWINTLFTGRRSAMVPEMWRILGLAYRREFRRMFGDGRFDAVVNFEGYSLFWTTVLAFAPEPIRKAVYLHSDMASECSLRHPYLDGLMRLYPHYDAIVSVSEAMNAVNRRNLVPRFGTDPDRHVWCPNMIDGGHILARAEMPLDADIAAWIGGRRSFLALGRLSPEKDYAKLVRAFAELHRAHPDACLLILGDGPLRADLAVQVADAGLESAVMLAGLRANPFPALKRCDCFVLSSNHEGQPMVLLEALVLGKPIIATDIDGCRAMLAGGYGRLTENSAEGLYLAMRDFLERGLAVRPFDAAAYEAEALACFHRLLAPAGVQIPSRNPVLDSPGPDVVDLAT